MSGPPFDNAALMGVGSCGCHQQVMGGLVSEPSGLPEGALAYADFKNGNYYYGGNALSDFLYAEAEFWGGEFNPAHVIEGVGYQAPNNTIEGPSLGLALTAEVTSADGFTLVAKISDIVEDAGLFRVLYLTNPDFDQELKAQLSDASGISSIGDYNASNQNLPSLVSGQSYRFALTMSATEIAMSVNGAATETYTVTDPFLCNYVAFQVQGLVWEDVVLYPPKAAGLLPALSAL